MFQTDRPEQKNILYFCVDARDDKDRPGHNVGCKSVVIAWLECKPGWGWLDRLTDRTLAGMILRQIVKTVWK